MNIAKRNRTDPAIVAYGLYMYFSSRSYRFGCKSLEPITKRSMYLYGNGCRSIPNHMIDSK
jgi:hypothetical protein